MEGGGPGGFGRNTWIKKACKADGDLVDGGPTERNINIGGKASVWMGKGDRLLIETPGGGAWGEAEGSQGNDFTHGHMKAWEPRGSLAERAAAQAGF